MARHRSLGAVVRFLGWALAAILVCDLAVVGARGLDDGDEGPAAAAPVPTGGVRTIYVLPAGQAKIRGTAVSVAADAELVPIIPTPVTVMIATRGEGGATIEGASVDGQAASIVWDGGRPLLINGDAGGIDTGAAHVEGAAGVLAVTLDGGVRGFVPGTYRITTPVAVGAQGLAEPRESVTFSATATTTLRTHGRASVRLPARALELEGPGSVSLDGRFMVETRDGTRTATRVVFGPGAFVLHLEPEATGWTITATVQGPLEAS
jgi:hypothetical protein